MRNRLVQPHELLMHFRAMNILGSLRRIEIQSFDLNAIKVRRKSVVQMIFDFIRRHSDMRQVQVQLHKLLQTAALCSILESKIFFQVVGFQTTTPTAPSVPSTWNGRIA